MLPVLKRVNTLIIGAAKAGTSSLAAWLDEHPQCAISRPKETMFFASEDLYGMGEDWYHTSCFGHAEGAVISCDATPAYTNRDRHSGVPLRVWNYNPDMKLIYMVREPLSRLVSTWQMFATSQSGNGDPVHEYAVLKAKEGFGAYLRDDSLFRNSVSTSRYRYQLDAWLEYFPASQLHIIFLEELEKRERSVLTELSNFLGIDSAHFMTATLLRRNTRDQRRQVSELRKKVVASPLGRVVKAVLPGRALKSLAESPLGRVPIPNPVAEWDPELRANFLDAVRDDLREFLEFAGRDPAGYAIAADA